MTMNHVKKEKKKVSYDVELIILFWRELGAQCQQSLPWI